MHFDSTLGAVAHLRGLGYRICVLEQVEGSVPLQEFSVEPGQAYAIIAGHEVKGVDQEVVDAADCCIEIPQFGSKHSLNVSVYAESPSGISSVICSLERLSKIHITFYFAFESLVGVFCLFFGHVATATSPHHKQKSIRQSFSKSVSYKFRQSLIMPILHLNKLPWMLISLRLKPLVCLTVEG